MSKKRILIIERLEANRIALKSLESIDFLSQSQGKVNAEVTIAGVAEGAELIRLTEDNNVPFHLVIFDDSMLHCRETVFQRWNINPRFPIISWTNVQAFTKNSANA